MVLITGDSHGNFNHVKDFCREHNTTKEDILIILGDAGINYFCDDRDYQFKKSLLKLPITLFCIKGNHELAPSNIENYELQNFHGGQVYVQKNYPNLLFAKDGDIYDFNGYSCIVIGGAYSVDKFYRLERGLKWFEDEQPSEEIKEYVENQLECAGWNIDVVLSHTAPLRYEPIEWFLSMIDQSTVDKSTEIWLDKICERLTFKKWYFGHYHGAKKIDKIQIMFSNIEEFEVKE